LPSRGPPYYGFLEMSIKPVVTGATTATRAGCVWRGLGFGVCPIARPKIRPDVKDEHGSGQRPVWPEQD